jgi:hypothetical protein
VLPVQDGIVAKDEQERMKGSMEHVKMTCSVKQDTTFVAFKSTSEVGCIRQFPIVCMLAEVECVPLQAATCKEYVNGRELDTCLVATKNAV